MIQYNVPPVTYSLELPIPGAARSKA